ncbi:MAG: GxxExxY protein [Candidatus Cloacimonetes bacterium]|nr:GxxExxY protein [Candidatus Cloacimonadota bacterium]MCF7813828.1 GxxExxY protein [Candidatus Cloacimonadota bacterium]MCF7868266.1 GxxExxY protein [Candidatus Cloacimonadota bacterium]MCF7883760.1 GxxExxY protein [Candidatus Cloacimonadota bacterium]
MKYKNLSDKIIGCAYKVYNTFGFGYLESVYEKCMEIEYKKNGLFYESQKQIAVDYDGINVGNFIADAVVENKIIIEYKSIIKLNKIHEMQLVNYLVATGIDVGLLINFGEEEVEIKRKVRDLKDLK